MIVKTTVDGIRNFFNLFTSLKGKTMAKNLSRVTDTVANTEPTLVVWVNPYVIGMTWIKKSVL